MNNLQSKEINGLTLFAVAALPQGYHVYNHEIRLGQGAVLYDAFCPLTENQKDFPVNTDEDPFSVLHPYSPHAVDLEKKLPMIGHCLSSGDFGPIALGTMTDEEYSCLEGNLRDTETMAGQKVALYASREFGVPQIIYTEASVRYDET
ncbi:hypothetical protein JXC34_04175, partial [Candidatus Woesearchaeota archaeon]|nr:hypothetical protein [Candidatus Woesearchaeota archaeon]